MYPPSFPLVQQSPSLASLTPSEMLSLPLSVQQPTGNAHKGKELKRHQCPGVMTNYGTMEAWA